MHPKYTDISQQNEKNEKTNKRIQNKTIRLSTDVLQKSVRLATHQSLKVYIIATTIFTVLENIVEV